MPYLSASVVVIHYKEALYQVYAPLPLPLPLPYNYFSVILKSIMIGAVQH